MRFKFIDNNGDCYSFELDADPSVPKPHVEIVAFHPPGGSITVRPIVDGKVKWYREDCKVSPEARRYLDKVIKNKAFL